MSHIIKTIAILSVTGFAAIAQAAEGEYYFGPSADVYQRIPGSIQNRVDPISTGSTVRAFRSKTTRDDRFSGDSGDYYYGASPR